MARLPVDNPFVITTQFGVPDTNARFGRHSGIDYAAPTGRQVFAPVSGTLTNVQSTTAGNMVVIFDGTRWHRLMHNSSFSRGNGRVEEGNEVARVGTTGLSTGPHVHWDVNTEGIYPTSFNAFVDPNSILNQGDDMIKPTKQQVAEAYLKHNLKADGTPTPATQADLEYYSTQDRSVLYAVLLDHETDLVHQLVSQPPGDAKVLPPGKYQVN